MIGTIAEQFFKRWQWLTLYFVGGMFAALVALLWQPIGAGNSIAVFALAGGIGMYAFKTRKDTILRMVTVVSVILALAVVILQDIHGCAFLAGFGISGIFANMPMREKAAHT